MKSDLINKNIEYRTIDNELKIRLYFYNYIVLENMYSHIEK